MNVVNGVTTHHFAALETLPFNRHQNYTTQLDHFPHLRGRHDKYDSRHCMYYALFPVTSYLVHEDAIAARISLIIRTEDQRMKLKSRAVWNTVR